MELNSLKPAKGSTHHDKRIGRGAGSGHGGTATRGHKGAQSRSGYSRKLGFEGGQMPLQRRLPKFGFTNLKRVEFKAINLSTLEELAGRGAESGDRQLLAALMSLPEKPREAMLLHYVEGYDVRETAKLLSLTPSCVKMRLKKGRELLGKEIFDGE